jgi:arylsulfate sulfotransferase
MIPGKIGLLLIASLATSQAITPAKFKPASRHRIDSQRTGTAVIGNQTQGPTPFIVQISATITPVNSLSSVQFSIVPKPGSVTRPISATYSANYLKSRSYLDPNNGNVVIPVFGLYANYSNTVTLTFSFTDNSSQQNNITVVTPVWNDPCGVFNNPTVLQARTSSTSLSYDYVMVKENCGSTSPLILDTDGEARWAGPTGGFSSFASIFFANGFYISGNPPSGSNPTGVWRIDFDGILTFVDDYSDIGVTSTGHHNYDPGKSGILMDVDTTAQTESVILEVDTFGNVLNTWNFANIISQAMTAGGDDPSQFVGSGSQDWFHNNSATYRKSDNTLIVSSRENFVIAVDYDTQQIKWILGDPTKHWFEFPSLRHYALTLDSNSLPPIGQHAVSISQDDDLLLFDDGRGSLFQNPPGADRTYSAPRKYQINTLVKTATEVWNYPNGETLYSPFCSSTYEDGRSDYLIDYAIISNLGSQTFAELVGLDGQTNKVFDYRYNTAGCSAAWNAIPIHLEALRFTSVQPLKAVSRKVHGSAGTFDLDLPLTGGTAIEPRAGDYQIVVTFPTNVGLNGATVTPGNGGTATVSGPPTVSGKNVAVNLTGVSTGQTLTVNLIGVTAGADSDNVSIPMSVLVGDTNQDRFTDSVDVSQTKAQSGNAVTYGNFREDVNADGFIDAIDVSLVKSKAGTALP